MEQQQQLDELKAKLAVLKGQETQTEGSEPTDDPYLKPYMVEWADPSWRTIPDDDPELAPHLTPPKHYEATDVVWQLVLKLTPPPRQKTLTEAKRILARRRKHEAIYATIVDQSQPREKRLEAIQQVLDTILPPGRHFLKQFSTAQLLDRICSPDTIRLLGDGREKVRRPPEDLVDVWLM